MGYQYMKKSLEPGDTLVIKELDRIGRNQEELKREWQYFRDNEINVRVLDLPALNINYDDETFHSYTTSDGHEIADRVWREFDEIFERYGLWYEFGYSWNLSAYRA